MTDSNIPMRHEHESHEHWSGIKNKSIRYWFYINKGMDFVNQFRNLFILIFGAYFVCKLHNPIWLVAMLLGSLPILGAVGYIQIHHIGKVVDWLNIKFSTHYGMYQIKLLEDIRDALKPPKNRHSTPSI